MANPSSSFSASTYAQRMERYMKQRSEWLQGLRQTLTPAVEKTLRKLATASKICSDTKPDSFDITMAFDLLVRALLTQWTDAEIVAEMGEKTSSDADTYLQMVVKAHATVLALSTAQKCRHILSVPSIPKFFRMVIAVCKRDFPDPGNFLNDDIDVRLKVRSWVDHIVSMEALCVVPVGIFTQNPGYHLQQQQQQQDKPRPAMDLHVPQQEDEPETEDEGEEQDEGEEHEEGPIFSEAPPSPFRMPPPQLSPQLPSLGLSPATATDKNPVATQTSLSRQATIEDITEEESPPSPPPMSPSDSRALALLTQPKIGETDAPPSK
jgi:hypothetical protein